MRAADPRASTGIPAPPRSASPTTSTGCSARSSSTRRGSTPAARSPAASAATPGSREFTRLGRLEELGWRTRIEGSQGIPERELNGPVAGLAAASTATGIAALGADFPTVDRAEQERRLDAVPEFKQLLYEHACEGAYGAPEYGGNRDGRGWQAIEFPGDVQPRGYTDVEVAGRE